MHDLFGLKRQQRGGNNASSSFFLLGSHRGTSLSFFPHNRAFSTRFSATPIFSPEFLLNATVPMGPLC